MKLTAANYYGPKANREYMSVSQFKAFQKCPAAAMAELKGEYLPERGRALVLGSLVDESLTGTKKSLEKYCEETREWLYKKNGDPYADVEQALETVGRIRKQPLMMKYLTGKHQVIMTGEIQGVPFKIKMDTYKPGEWISDLKYMASLKSPNIWTPMVEYWGYDIQAACYQEIVYQNTGKRLPFYFEIGTKERPAHLVHGQINQYNIDKAMEKVAANIQYYQRVKTGELPAERCEDYDCDYCTGTRLITEVLDTDLFGLNAAQIKAMQGEI